jgi:hypothetical protein
MNTHRNPSQGQYRHSNSNKQQRIRVQDTPKKQEVSMSASTTCDISLGSYRLPSSAPPLVSASFNGNLSTTQLENVQQMMMLNQACQQLNNISLTQTNNTPVLQSYPLQQQRIPSLFEPNSFQYVPDEIFEMEMEE